MPGGHGTHGVASFPSLSIVPLGQPERGVPPLPTTPPVPPAPPPPDGVPPGPSFATAAKSSSEERLPQPATMRRHSTAHPRLLASPLGMMTKSLALAWLRRKELRTPAHAARSRHKNRRPLGRPRPDPLCP